MLSKYIAKRKTLGNNPKNVLITLLLMLTIAFPLFVLPSVSAHDPPWSIQTYVYADASPSPIGVNQNVLVHIWLSECPPTAIGPYGDRWKGLTVEITAPDGSKKTLGPFTSDSVGGAWTTYTPNQIGAYSIQGIFPGQKLAGENLIPKNITNDGNRPAGREVYVGDYYEPSKSAVFTLTVQEKAIEPYSDTPLPTGYWARPIDAQHRSWWSIAGNWLKPPARTEAMFAPYTTAPEAAHILWAESLTIGGLIGGEYGSRSFHVGAAYEGKWSPPVIIAGTVYYNKYPDDIKNAGEYRAEGPKPGVVAMDLRTGEQIWYKPDMPRISFGQIYYYGSPDQNGAFAYLWSINGSTWTSYEAFTGDKVYTIKNVPSGTQVYGVNGEILVYQLNIAGKWLALWNNTAMPELQAGLDYYSWLWRPHGKTLDAKSGYMWNVTIPTGLTGAINKVLVDEAGKPDRIIGSIGLNTPGYSGDVENFTIWSLNLKPGQEGQLLWQKFYVAPYRNVIVTMAQCPASLKDGIFTLFCAETREWFGYSLNTGDLLWTTKPQGAWDIFYETSGSIAYGKLYSGGVAGTVYCYDLKTGASLWAYPVSDPTWEAMYSSNYPIRLAIIADGKIYVDSTEHSPNNPLARGAPLVCINAETGAEIWKIPMYRQAWGGGPAVADGIIITVDSYDSRIYAFGKGQTKTTVSIQNDVVAKGNSVLIKGTVIDQSPGAKDTPAIADKDMTEWMKYVYMQFPKPSNATGVQVKLTAIDPNGNTQDIGTVTSDSTGMYGIMWAPPVEGLYKIIATFEGSESYYRSSAETMLGVGAERASPVSPTVSPTAIPTIAPTSTPINTASPSPVPNTGLAIGTEVYLGITAVVVFAAVAATALFLRKRK
jgi:hypothetical protein